MSKWARGRYSKSVSDRSGMVFPYDEMVKEWNGALVHTSEFEPKQPQIRTRRVVADAIALQNTRSQKFQQPKLMSALNPTYAPNDNVLCSSGGAMIGIANLTLPGDFAFRTQTYKTESWGITTSVSSMYQENPSLQNRRRVQ